MNPLQPLLTDSLKVIYHDQNHVEIRITLPADCCDHFLAAIEAFTGFATILRNQVRFSQIKKSSQRATVDHHAEENKRVYYQRIVKEFDRLTSQGHSRYQSIKLISAGLRKENHPWSSPDLVRPSLAAAGRPGQPGRPRRQS